MLDVWIYAGVGEECLIYVYVCMCLYVYSHVNVCMHAVRFVPKMTVYFSPVPGVQI